MKKGFTLSLALLTGLAFAQTAERSTSHREEKNEKRFAQHGHFMHKNPAARSKTAQTTIHQLDSLTYDTIAAGAYIAYDLETYYYDAAGNDTLVFWLEPDGNGNWVTYYKQESSFNANNQIITAVEFYENGSGLEQSWKSTYTYNTSNQLDVQIESSWNGMSWQDVNRITFTYNNGNLVEELQEYNNSGTWTSGYKTEFTYNASNQLTGDVEYYWTGTQWDSSAYNLYTYTATTQTIDEYYFDGTSFALNFKAVYTLDAAGNTTEIIYQESDGSTLVNVGRQNLTYDLSVSLNDLFIPRNFADGLFANKLTAADFDYWDGTAWQAEERLSLYYSLNSIGLTETPVSVSVYPNPATTQVNFSSPVAAEVLVEVFNLQGQKVLEATVSQNQNLDVSALARGTYIYNISNTDTPQTGKIVLK